MPCIPGIRLLFCYFVWENTQQLGHECRSRTGGYEHCGIVWVRAEITGVTCKPSDAPSVLAAPSSTAAPPPASPPTMVKLKINPAGLAAASSASVSHPPRSESSTPSSSKANGKPAPKIKLKTTAKPPAPKLKIKSSSFSSTTPLPLRTPISLKLKTPKGPLPRKRKHEPGNGYDSEASDREDDPAIEEQFILRMPPGEDCDYLRGVIERKELSVTSDVWLRFKEQRRAVVCVRGRLYGALLVDLPCIIEANKTIDKKHIFKAADICQMLLVGDRIASEEEVWGLPAAPQNITYPHGITPPMLNVRKRRFRKRISNRTIEAVETEVERLLREDEKAESSRQELVDTAQLMRENSAASDAGEDEGYNLFAEQEEYDDEQDAAGEEEMEYDFTQGGQNGEMDDELANDLESALLGAGVDDGNMAIDLPTDTAPIMVETPAAEESESDEEEEDEEEVPPAEMDEVAKEAAQQKEKLREEIQDLEETIRAKEREYQTISNSMLKSRVQKVITSLRGELELKMSSMGDVP